MSTNYEPKRKFRWILRVPGIPEFLALRVDRPSYRIDYRSVVPVRTYEPVKIRLIDTINPNTAHLVEQITRNSPNLGDIELDTIDCVGQVIDRWILVNPFVTRVDYSRVDYADSESCCIDLEIMYTDFELSVQDGFNVNQLWIAEVD